MPARDLTQNNESQASRASKRRIRRDALLLALVLLAALLPYWRSLGYGFVWDDGVIIPKLETYGDRGLGRVLATPFDSFLGDPMRHPNYFRPATLASLWLDRTRPQVGLGAPDRPGTFHRTNLILYALACVFLWLLASDLTGDPVAAAAGATVFALHPTHPESVCFISGRTDLMAGVFLFASLWLAARWGPRIRNPAWKLAPAAASLLVALFSKEVAFLASPVVLVVLWIRDRGIRGPRMFLAAAPLVLADAIYLGVRWAVLGWRMAPTVSPVQGPTAQFLTSVAVVGRYIPLLLFPVSLSARHEVLPLARPDVSFFAGAAVLALIGAGLWALFRRRSRWLVPMALFAATLLPLCDVRLIAGALVAERFLFIPSAALALAVAFLPRPLPRWTAGIVAPFFLVLLLPRVEIWKDDAALYTSMVRDSPGSPHAHAILGQYYYRQHDFPRAIEHQKRAFQLMPEYNETLLDLSAAEDEAGQTDSALAHVRLLLRLRPEYPAAWYSFGNFQVRKDRPDSAVAAYREALRLDPSLAQAENNLGVVLERMGHTQEALAHYRRSEELLPGFPDAANNLARLSARKNP
jgi:tetratricopeptide (TPR) repeat protein